MLIKFREPKQYSREAPELSKDLEKSNLSWGI